MKLSNHLLWLPWIPNLGEFVVQSVMVEIFYIFNSNSLKILLIIMKPMAHKELLGVSTKECQKFNILPLKVFMIC